MARGWNTLYLDYRRKGPNGEYEYERPGLGYFVVQSVLAGVLVACTALVAQLTTSLLALAAMASTAFVVFARPKSIEAKPRNVLGGHVASVIVGAACALAASVLPLSGQMQVIVLGGVATALSLFSMSILDVEHAPAAGVALAMVCHSGEFLMIGVVALGGGAAISLSGVLLGRWLKDLT